MTQTHTTFHGKTIPLNEIEHQHLSNIIWYNTIVLDYPVEYCREFLNELRNRYNGQLLPYRPHVDFAFEMKVLRQKGMLRKDSGNPLRIIIFGEGKEVGEIICVDESKVQDIILPDYHRPDVFSVDKPIDWRREYDPTESKQYHISFGVIREHYKREPAYRPTLKALYKEALDGIDQEIKQEELAIKRAELIRLADETRKKEEENAKPMFEVGILLRRRNHPLNVYTVQRNGNTYGIYNITHGQWWGNTVPVNNMRMLSVKDGKSLKKYVTKGEFLIMCGSHNPDNFYSFDEANDLIKK